jgi:hypothetical protein
MTHFADARKNERRHTRGYSAAVMVILRGHRPLVVQVLDQSEEDVGPVCILGPYKPIIALPEDASVLDIQGQPIKAEHRFWVSAETFDPIHLLIDREEP